VITEARKATNALRNAVLEMERRLKLLAAQGVRNIDQYNRKIRAMQRVPRSLFEDDAPEPEELQEIDVWADPAVQEEDYDGFVAEAMAAGVIVVAARTAVNDLRCEKGRTGFLVPPCDPNELTHGILSALFKPEMSRGPSVAARQTVSKYRSRHRLRVLSQMYEQLLQ